MAPGWLRRLWRRPLARLSSAYMDTSFGHGAGWLCLTPCLFVPLLTSLPAPTCPAQGSTNPLLLLFLGLVSADALIGVSA